MKTDGDVLKQIWRGLGLGVKKVERYVPKIDTAYGLPDEETNDVAKAEVGAGEVVVHRPLWDRGNRREPPAPTVRKREPKDDAADIARRFAETAKGVRGEIAKLSEQPAPAPRRPKAVQSTLPEAIREVFGLDARKAERRHPKTFAENLAEARVEAEILKIEAVQRLLATAPGVQKAEGAQGREVRKATRSDLQRRVDNLRVGDKL